MLRKAMFAAALTLALAGPASADKLLIDGIDKQAANGEMPSAGITKDRVMAGWGDPASKMAAVGEPPISRWIYGDFVVYFEYDHVIHAVVKR
jgi:hypothetical protein